MKKLTNNCVVSGVVVLALLLGSCTTYSVSRVSADTQIDLSGRWNDTDSRQVAQDMIDDVLRRPWLVDFVGRAGEKPVVIVGGIRNRSSEHIDSGIFTKDIERELINSGQVRFVASSEEREGVRDERMDQQIQANPETIARLGMETGADFYLGGVITSQTDAIEGKRVISYKVDLELIHIETNEKVWIGSKQIKKYIEQRRSKL